MNIAIDISPLKTGHFLQHRVRGTGFYVENLKASLLKYFPQNHYSFFTKGEKIPQGSDIVHIPYFEPYFLTLPFGRKNNMVVTVHDLTPLAFPKNFPGGIKGSIKWKLQKNLLRRASGIIADSVSSKKDINKYAGIPNNKIHVVYLAAAEHFRVLEDEKVSQRIKEKYKLPQKFALYVGDATWNKNLLRIIEASEMANVPLVMVGKALSQENFDRANPWNKDLSKVRELTKLNKNVHLTGFVPDEDLVFLYNAAEVFVMPSIYEGFGLPVLEAMSCGCPVVASREGSLPEVAGDAALYVDAYSSGSITEGIEKVLLNKNLSGKLRKKGLEQAKKFSWKKTASDTIKVYEQLTSIVKD